MVHQYTTSFQVAKSGFIETDDGAVYRRVISPRIWELIDRGDYDRAIERYASDISVTLNEAKALIGSAIQDREERCRQDSDDVKWEDG